MSTSQEAESHPRRLVDTSVFLRYLTRDDEDKAARVRQLLDRVNEGAERVQTSTLVVFETVYALQHLYHVPRPEIRDLLVPLLEMPRLGLPEKALCLEALELFGELAISFAYAYQAIYARRERVEVYSWDHDFDRVKGVIRREP